MKNIWIMTLYTLREAMARKVFIFFLIISLVVLIGAAVIFALTNTESLVQGVNLEENSSLLPQIVRQIEMGIIAALTALCILLSIFAGASFIPVMLEKGNIDLLLSKPVSRTQLLLGKYLGGLLVVFINIGILVLGTWLIISLKFGYWNFSFLLMIPLITFTFAVLYAFMAYLGIVTQGSTLSMMSAYIIFLILSPVLHAAKDKSEMLFSSQVVRSIVEGIYYIVPKTAELLGSVSAKLSSGQSIDSYQPVITSALFLILCLILGDYTLRKKDF